jgi:hypothetical protein
VQYRRDCAQPDYRVPFSLEQEYSSIIIHEILMGAAFTSLPYIAATLFPSCPHLSPCFTLTSSLPPSLACLRTPSHETPIFFLYIGLVQEHTNKKRATSSHMEERERKKKDSRCLVVTQPISGCWVSSHKQ